jgi:hypothetical protein
MPQTAEEPHEFALLFFEPAQGLGAILVKGAVAARGSVAVPGASPPWCRPCRLQPVGPALHAFHAALPTVPAAFCPACHSAASDQKPEQHQSEGPQQNMVMHDLPPM